MPMFVTGQASTAEGVLVKPSPFCNGTILSYIDTLMLTGGRCWLHEGLIIIDTTFFGCAQPAKQHIST